MKKITKFLVVALSLALLIGAVVGVSSSAAETEGEKWVVSKNVSYDENTHLFFAIDASLAEDSSLLKVDVLDAAGTSLVGEELLTVSEESVDIYEDGSMTAHVVKTPGVAAKDFADVFTINVYYGDATEPVDSITYSVAEYFLQRLYKDGIIDAVELAEGTDEEIADAKKAVSQKKLYEASLRYGAAAQKVLTDDTVFVDELVYVASPEQSGVISNNRISLGDGIYNVKSYVGDEIVNSVVGGGDYYVENSAVITKFAVPVYGMNENGTKVEGFTIPEGETSTAWAYDTENDSVLMGYHNHGGADYYNAPTVSEENGEQYINFLKNNSASSSAQTSMVWVKNNDTTGETSLTFEVKMRINSMSGTFYFRAYTGRTITDPSSGTCFASSGSARNIAFTATGMGNDTIGNVKFGVDTSEWFTLRFDMTGTTVMVYTAADGNQLEYRGTIDKSTHWSGKDLANATTLILMNDSSAKMDIDVAYSYFGKALEVPEAADTPELTESDVKFIDATTAQMNAKASYLDADDEDGDGSTTDAIATDAPLWKGGFTVLKDIITGQTTYILDDIAGSSPKDNGKCTKVQAETYDLAQPINRYYISENATGGNTFVFSADMYFDSASNGNFSSSASIWEVRFNTAGTGGATDTRPLGVYMGGGKIQYSRDDGSQYVENAFPNKGEWFNLRIEVTIVGTSASDGQWLVKYYVNDKMVGAGLSGAFGGNAFMTSADMTTVSFIPSRGFVGTFQVKNVELYHTNVTIE